MKFLLWTWRHFEDVLGTICFAVVVGAVSINVFMRYALNDDLTGASEIATTMFLWTVMFGIGAAARRRQHPSIDLVTRIMPPRVGTAIQLIVDLIIIYLLADLTISGWHFAWESGFDKFTGALKLPYVYTYLALPTGLAIMLIRVLVNLVSDTRFLLSGNPGERRGQEVEDAPEERGL